MSHRREITAELLVIRHPDPYPEINGITGEIAVNKPDIVPHPDGGIQIAEFFKQANQRALEKYIQYDPTVTLSHLRHIDKALSSPRVRAIMAWTDILPLFDSVANHHKRPVTQSDLDQWTKSRFETKLRQEDLISWKDSIAKVKQDRTPWDIYKTISILEEEIRREQLAMLAGIQVDNRLRDIIGSEVGQAGISKKIYSRLTENSAIPQESWFNLFNCLNAALEPPGEEQQGTHHPIHRAVALTHGTNVVIFESLINYRGREEEVAGKTYRQIKAENSGAIPHGSGIQILKYNTGELESHRILTVTNEDLEIRYSGEVQPPPPDYLDAETMNIFWRE